MTRNVITDISHPTGVITLAQLLAANGFIPQRNRVKLVRHADARFDIAELIQNGWFERYQQFQGKPVFDGCDQIVSFVGEDGMKSRFVGVFDVGDRLPAEEAPDREPQIPGWMDNAKYWYPLRHRTDFEDLENRLIIHWGSNARAWHRWFVDREVIEIRPKGRMLPPFRDYLKVHLTMRQLRALEADPDVHRDWVAGLRAVGGVYLIVSTATGQQYVGSATGDSGIWQRWAQYATSGHCGNSGLVKLCKRDPRHPEAFTFSILETFSRTTAKAVALQQETFFKKKLGSRAFGLNDN